MNNLPKKIVVDSSKDADRLEILLKDKDIKVIVVHLVRDGRAAVWSYWKKYKKMLPYALKWFFSNLKLEILKRRNNMNYVFISYEDFVKNPDVEIEKILNKAGLIFDKKMLEFGKMNNHLVGGNRLRLGAVNKIKEDDEWKKEQPFFHRFIFNIFFGWVNFFYKIIKRKNIKIK